MCIGAYTVYKYKSKCKGFRLFIYLCPKRALIRILKLNIQLVTIYKQKLGTYKRLCKWSEFASDIQRTSGLFEPKFVVEGEMKNE